MFALLLMLIFSTHCSAMEYQHLAADLCEEVTRGDFEHARETIKKLDEKVDISRVRVGSNGKTFIHYAVMERNKDRAYPKAYSKEAIETLLPISCAPQDAECIIDALLRHGGHMIADARGNTAMHYLLDTMQGEEDVILAKCLTQFPYSYREYLPLANNDGETVLQKLQKKAETNDYCQKLLAIFQRRLKIDEQQSSDEDTGFSLYKWCTPL